MKKYSIFLLVLLAFALCYGQYTLKESYYGAGGPVGASGGGYDMWGSALGQTAVTTVNGGTYKDEQGFYHGEKMLYVYFCAEDTQRAVNGDADAMSIWGDTLKVVVHYLYRGIWKDDTIGTPGTLAVWVDSVQSGDNFWYEKKAIFQSAADGSCPEGDPCDPNYHRWARPDTANNDVAVVDPTHAGTQTEPKLVTIDFYEQFRTANPIEFDPPDSSAPRTFAGGLVDYVNFKKFGGDSVWDDSLMHADTVRIWADKGNAAYTSKFIYSDTTDSGWITISSHTFNPYIKTVNNVIKYQQPYNATYANNILWRRYTLFGVPLYPREDTVAYRHFAHAHGCDSTGLGYGEQDIVLYDDMHTVCGDSSDSNCGTWESWYRILRYYPSEGSYRRYQGPDGTHNPDRFSPGLGFWGNQIHCDAIPFDVYGVMADTTDSFEMPLWKYDGSSNNTKYNMLANPFYNPQDDTIKVRPDKWQVRHFYATGDSTAKITDAAVARWLQGYIAVWRRVSETSWAYVHIAINGEVADDTLIYEWEGYWIMTDTLKDSLDVIMYVESQAPAALLRRTTMSETEWFVQLSAKPQNGYEWDVYNRAGFSTRKFADCEEMPPFTYPPDIKNPMRLYFTKDGKELAYSFYNEEQNIYSYHTVLEPGQYSDQQITLYWDVSKLPDGYIAMLKIPGIGDVDLRAQSEVTLPPAQGKSVEMELYIYPVSAPVSAAEQHLPDKFFLSSAIPNPFNLTATIQFGIPYGHGNNVQLEIYDQSGRKVRTLWNKSTAPGYYSVVWDGKNDMGNNVPTGIYFCRIVHPEFTDTKRAVLIK